MQLLNVRLENVENDWRKLEEAELPPEAEVLTFSEIINRVLNRNFELLVKAKEYEYRYELATGSKLKMIPPLVVTGEISYRNRNTGLSSESLVPGIPPAPPSISTDQFVNRYDLTLTWNLLDFGISYFRARQAADQSVIQLMEYEKVKQGLIQETIEQYWKARTAQLGVVRSRQLIQEANELIEFVNEQIDAQILPKDKALYQERLVLRQEVQLQLLEKEYHTAISELAKLMGTPTSNFSLAEEDIGTIDIELPEPVELEKLALLNRPELYGLDMQEQMTIAEAQVALLQVFPSLAPFIGSFFDSNSFLIYHRWIYGGLRYTWNLLAMPYHMQDYLSELQHRRVNEYERLGVSLGILTQVNLSIIAYEDTKREYELVKKLADVNQSLLAATEMREEFGETSLADVITNFRFDALLSEIEALRAYGYLQAAIAKINTSIGLPFYLSSRENLTSHNDCEEDDV